MSSELDHELESDPNNDSLPSTFENPININNEFPGAIVNIVSHPIPGYYETIHSTGDPAKSLIRLLVHRETGNYEVLQGFMWDALAMNTGDIASAGFYRDLVLRTALRINSGNVRKDSLVLQLNLAMREIRGLYAVHGINMRVQDSGITDSSEGFNGADLDVSVHSLENEERIIRGSVSPGDNIMSFASDGKAKWERRANSGIMSIGLDAAMIGLLNRDYTKKYPELVGGNVFRGRFNLGDRGGLKYHTVSEALLSPTRQWIIVIKSFMDKLRKAHLDDSVHGIIMHAGGVSKMKKLGKGGITYDMLNAGAPEIFQLIQSETGKSWDDMYRDFNCGIGLSVIGKLTGEVGRVIRDTAAELGIAAYDSGVCVKSHDEDNHVRVGTPYGDFDY